ncbi:MAG: phosphatidate cytidylyltransferase [Lachnospiraceae bacterium]
MFKTRLLSGIMLVIIALLTLISGGDILFAVLLIISLIGMSELYKILDVHKKLLGIAGYFAAIGYYGLIRFDQQNQIMLLVISLLIVLMMIYVFSYPTYRSEQVMMTFFCFFYVAVMLSYIYQIRILSQGVFLVWLVFICSWGCDTCAYCVGMLIGKHKMAPKLSPKKSIEGGIGGILGAALLGALYALVINYFAGEAQSVAVYALIGGVGGAISQVGDLAASAIKRNHDIKDYGKLIPGHGGILDRFDSVIFTAPVIYYLAVGFLG